MGSFIGDLGFSTLTCQRRAPGGFAARLDPNARSWLRGRGSQPPFPSHHHGSIPTRPQPLLGARARREDALWAPVGAGASSSPPGSVPGKTVELSASYN